MPCDNQKLGGVHEVCEVLAASFTQAYTSPLAVQDRRKIWLGNRHCAAFFVAEQRELIQFAAMGLIRSTDVTCGFGRK